MWGRARFDRAPTDQFVAGSRRLAVAPSSTSSLSLSLSLCAETLLWRRRRRIRRDWFPTALAVRTAKSETRSSRFVLRFVRRLRQHDWLGCGLYLPTLAPFRSVVVQFSVSSSGCDFFGFLIRCLLSLNRGFFDCAFVFVAWLCDGEERA